MRHRTCRSGYSLLEVLMVVSLLGVTLSLSATLLGTAFRRQTRATDRLQLDRTLEQLGSRLRLDAHAAQSAQKPENGDDGSAVKLQMAGGRTIVYEVSEDGLNRLVKVGDKLEHRDRFQLTGCRVRIALKDGVNSAEKLVVVSLTARATHPTAAPAQFVPIQATVGLHPVSSAMEERP